MGELRIFPRHESADDVYLIGGAWAPACITAVEKRFTDAELAAEYWGAYSDYVREASNVLHCQERYMEAAGASFQESMRKCATLHRFATLPDYDQEES